jgi:hypothetical protein
MADVDLTRGFFLSVGNADITVSDDQMVIETEDRRVTITGADYDRLKAEIARHVSPAAIMGKPMHGITGDVYLGIRGYNAD